MQAFSNARDERLSVETAGRSAPEQNKFDGTVLIFPAVTRLAGVVTDLIRSNRLPEWQERFRNIQSSCQDGEVTRPCPAPSCIVHFSLGVAKLFRPVSKAFRKRFASARKWFKGKMTSIFESLSHKGQNRFAFLIGFRMCIDIPTFSLCVF